MEIRKNEAIAEIGKILNNNASLLDLEPLVEYIHATVMHDTATIAIAFQPWIWSKRTSQERKMIKASYLCAFKPILIGGHKPKMEIKSRSNTLVINLILK